MEKTTDNLLENTNTTTYSESNKQTPSLESLDKEASFEEYENINNKEENTTKKPSKPRPPATPEFPVDPTWVDVLSNGRFFKKMIKKGDEEKKGSFGCKVSIHFTESILDPTTENPLNTKLVFDSRTSQPLTFYVGDGDIIQALDMLSALMNEGEIALMRTSYKYAYGEKGRSPLIPPLTNLEYKVELLSVIERREMSDIDPEERYETALFKKNAANKFFADNELDKSANSYKRALPFVDRTLSSGTEEKRFKELRIQISNNLSLVYLKFDMFDKALETAEQVLLDDRENSKAWFRKGVSLTRLSQFEEAMESLKVAIQYSPNDKSIRDALRDCTERKKAALDKEKSIYANMMTKLKTTDLYDHPEPKNESDEKEEEEGEASWTTYIMKKLGLYWIVKNEQTAIQVALCLFLLILFMFTFSKLF